MDRYFLLLQTKTTILSFGFGNGKLLIVKNSLNHTTVVKHSKNSYNCYFSSYNVETRKKKRFL